MQTIFKKISDLKHKPLDTAIIEEFQSSLDSLVSPLLVQFRKDNSSRETLINEAIQIWRTLCEDDLGLANSRLLISSTIKYFEIELYSKECSDIGSAQRSLLRSLLESFLEISNARSNSLEDFIASSRELLADLFEFDEEWTQAANALSGIPLESGHRVISDQEKLNIYIKIMRLLLEAEDTTSAGSYVNRAAALIVPSIDPQQNILFKTCQARILDANCSFQKAAWKYFELSCNSLISEEDRLTALAQSMKCIVLAEAGPQRSRFLTTIYKDDRSKHVDPGVLFTVIEYMYLDRMIIGSLKREFSEQLSPHQLAKLADGSTLLDRAIVEHNIVSCSKFYKSVYFDQLATILDIPEQSVELTVGKIIAEGNLAASIDQIERLIFFHEVVSVPDPDKTETSSQKTVEVQLDPVAATAKQMDVHIADIGNHVEDIIYLIRSKYPDWLLSRTN